LEENLASKPGLSYILGLLFALESGMFRAGPIHQWAMAYHYFPISFKEHFTAFRFESFMYIYTHITLLIIF
jgi:hypothetical protein